MGWFKSQKELTANDETFHLQSVQGKILYAMDVEIEDEGEFITFLASAKTEPILEEADNGSTQRSSDISE